MSPSSDTDTSPSLYADPGVDSTRSDPTPYQRAAAAYVATLRQAGGLTVTGVSTAIGIARRTLQRIEAAMLDPASSTMTALLAEIGGSGDDLVALYAISAPGPTAADGAARALARAAVNARAVDWAAVIAADPELQRWLTLYHLGRRAHSGSSA